MRGTNTHCVLFKGPLIESIYAKDMSYYFSSFNTLHGYSYVWMKTEIRKQISAWCYWIILTLKYWYWYRHKPKYTINKPKKGTAVLHSQQQSNIDWTVPTVSGSYCGVCYFLHLLYVVIYYPYGLKPGYILPVWSWATPGQLNHRLIIEIRCLWELNITLFQQHFVIQATKMCELSHKNLEIVIFCVLLVVMLAQWVQAFMGKSNICERAIEKKKPCDGKTDDMKQKCVDAIHWHNKL